MPDGNQDTLRDFYRQLDRKEHRQLAGFLKIEDAFPKPGTEKVFVICRAPG